MISGGADGSLCAAVPRPARRGEALDGRYGMRRGESFIASAGGGAASSVVRVARKLSSGASGRSLGGDELGEREVRGRAARCAARPCASPASSDGPRVAAMVACICELGL